MKEIMDKIAVTTKAIQDAKEAYSVALKEAVDPTLDHIAKNCGELDVITIIGYTPGFNDGEPCTHGSYWGFGWGFLAGYGIEDYVEDYIEVDDEDLLEEKMDELLNKKVTVSQEVEDFVREVLDPYFEEKLETDYRVHILFENGTYKIEEHEYDCGY